VLYYNLNISAGFTLIFNLQILIKSLLDAVLFTVVYSFMAIRTALYTICGLAVAL
jgi:hypothetical protein